MVSDLTSRRWSSAVDRFLHPGWVLLIVAGIFLLYSGVLHPWMMSWGSTEAERTMALPGDEFPLNGKTYFNRAITIDAPAPVVWQWLVQLGQDRAGFYSNDYLENLTGANIHNSNEIRPEWQSRKVGDAIPMSRPDLLGGAMGDSLLLRVTAVEPGRMMTTEDSGRMPERYFVLSVDEHTTRLLLRERYMAPTMGAIGATWIFDPMHFVMEQRMLRGIKERAEGDSLVPGWLVLASGAGWIMAGPGRGRDVPPRAKVDAGRSGLRCPDDPGVPVGRRLQLRPGGLSRPGDQLRGADDLWP